MSGMPLTSSMRNLPSCICATSRGYGRGRAEHRCREPHCVPVPRGPAGQRDPGQRSTRIGSLLETCQYKHEKNFMLFFSRKITHEFYAWDI
jgi:hypothetical protein